jgi:hypothetical protein
MILLIIINQIGKLEGLKDARGAENQPYNCQKCQNKSHKTCTKDSKRKVSTNHKIVSKTHLDIINMRIGNYVLSILSYRSNATTLTSITNTNILNYLS